MRLFGTSTVCDMDLSRSFVEAAEEREKDAQGNVFLTIDELIKRDQERRSGIVSQTVCSGQSADEAGCSG